MNAILPSFSVNYDRFESILKYSESIQNCWRENLDASENIDTFRQIRDRRIPFKTKVTLILCIFSGSDVGSKWWLLCLLLHPTTKHLYRLIRDILSSPEQRRTALSSLRGGLRQVGLVNQLSWEGPVQNYIILTGISEQSDSRKGILK